LLSRISDNGATLTLIGGGSPRRLRGRTARVAIIDECDALDMLTEGNLVDLCVQRTISFDNRKILVGSTPLHESTSHVTRLYAQSSQNIWEVPCVACGAYAEITWSSIEWKPDKPETAAWRCPHCAELIEHSHKAAMVRKGQWRALNPEVRHHVGFKINSLVSPLANASWGKLAAEFLLAKDDTDTLRVFINTASRGASRPTK